MGTPDMLRYAKIPLNNGSGAMPAVGFGTLIPDPTATKQATKTALEAGFRHFDCAERYRNEEAIGEAMQEVFRAGAIRREDVFITTKLWNTNHRPERVKAAFDGSRRRLQIDTVDCYIIHTPFAFQPGDNQDPRDERGQVIYDSGVTLSTRGKRSSASLTRVSASRSAFQMSLWTRCGKSSRLRGSNLPPCKSNPIRTSLNGSCSTSAGSTALSSWRLPHWDTAWIRDCWMIRSSQASLSASARRLPRWRWPGRYNAARRS